MASRTEEQVRVELDAEGMSSGVEAEDIGGEAHEPFDPRQIDVVTEVRSLDILLRRLRSGQIDLDPDFQRSRGIWTREKKSLLIESLLLRIPLPTFYVAELESPDAELGENPWSVVDGIQRLSTIAEFVDPTAIGSTPLMLHKLEYLHDEEAKTFDQLSPSLQYRILESQFTMQVIRKSTPDAVKLNIFARINTGGVPLSLQELRHALTPGEARKVLRDMAASDAFKEAVNWSVSPTRMADREMALRYLAFRLVDPEVYRESDLDAFLRTTMKQINEWSPKTKNTWLADFEHAMIDCRRVFDNDAFRKRYDPVDQRRPVSKALFECVAVSMARIRATSGAASIERLVERAAQAREGFIELMNLREFDQAVSQGTGDPVKVRARFSMMREMLDGVASPR